jgi:hypothetical protein
MPTREWKAATVCGSSVGDTRELTNNQTNSSIRISRSATRQPTTHYPLTRAYQGGARCKSQTRGYRVSDPDTQIIMTCYPSLISYHHPSSHLSYPSASPVAAPMPASPANCAKTSGPAPFEAITPSVAAIPNATPATWTIHSVKHGVTHRFRPIHSTDAAATLDMQPEPARERAARDGF